VKAWWTLFIHSLCSFCASFHWACAKMTYGMQTAQMRINEETWEKPIGLNLMAPFLFHYVSEPAIVTIFKAYRQHSITGPISANNIISGPASPSLQWSVRCHDPQGLYHVSQPKTSSPMQLYSFISLTRSPQSLSLYTHTYTHTHPQIF
jgi:hypothetical protein